LKLKVFSYDALESPKGRLINVRVQLKGETDRTLNLTTDPLNDGFKNLNEGKYKLEFHKLGYTKRVKQLELDCDLIDGEKRVWNHTYLWRDKKFISDEADLIVDEKGDSTETSSTNVTSPTSDGNFGKVTVKVLIDEDGNVISVSRIDGEKDLSERAILMARRTKFSPTLIKGSPFQVTGSLVYNFVP
jgi:TonB family protein